MAAKKNAAVTIKFNTRVYSFTKPQLDGKVRQALRRTTPPDGSNLLHQVRLPGVKYPVSLQWAVFNLLEVPAQIVSAKSVKEDKKNPRIRGAYHPAQALSALSKLAPLGVRVQSTSPNARYLPWLTDKVKKQVTAAATKKTSTKKAATKKAATKKTAAKKTAKK